MFGFLYIRNKKSAISIQQSQKILRVYVTRLGQLFHLFCCSIPFRKRQFLIFDRPSQFPARPGESPVIYPAATILHVLVLKGNLILPDALGLLDHRVFNSAELFLMRQRRTLAFLL